MVLFKFKLKKIIDKTLTLDIQLKYLEEFVEDFKKKGWAVEFKRLK